MTRSASTSVWASWSSQYKDASFSPYAELGGANDEHLTIGANDASLWWFKAGLVFPFSFSGMATITSATMYIRLTAGVHLSRVGTYPGYELYRSSPGTPSAGGSVETSLNTVSWAGISEFLLAAGQLGGNSQGSTQTIDVMPYIYQVAPSSVYVNGYGWGLNQTNYAMVIAGRNLASYGRTEFWSAADAGGRGPYVTIGYELPNEAPYAPTIASPGNGSTLTGGGTVTVLMSSNGDIDGDAITSASIETGEVDNYGQTPTWGAKTTTWNGSYWTASHTTPTRGKWVAIRGRVMDAHSAWSGYSSTSWVKINALPNTPTITAGMQPIHNLDDLAAWSGSEAKPQIQFGVSDPDGNNINAFDLELSTTSQGADLLSLATQTGTWASGTTVTYNLNYGLPADTNYFLRCRVRDSNNEWSSWDEEQIKVQWSQAVYEHNVGTGAAQYIFETGALTGSSPSAAYIFRSATDAASGSPTYGPWVSSIDQAEGEDYVNILVRLSIGRDTSTATALADMGITYIGASTVPDQWAFSGADTGQWELTESIRRYGTKSLRWVRSSATMSPTYAEAHTTDGTNVAVVPVVENTTYTLSAWIKPVLLDDGEVYAYARRVGESTDLAATSVLSASSNEWTRVTTTFTTPAGTMALEVGGRYDSTAANAGDVIYFDAIQLEEGTVASSWNPGSIGAVVVDVGGIAIDGEAGGTFRLRGTAGNDVVELGANGLELNGEDIRLAPWPVGSVFIAATTVDPNTALGGTWVEFGAGRNLVGLDTGDANRDTLLETGGSLTHTHGYSTVISHQHDLSNHTHAGGAHYHGGDQHYHTEYGDNGAASNTTLQRFGSRGGNSVTINTTDYGNSASATTNWNTANSTGGPSSNVTSWAGSASGTTGDNSANPPFIVVKYWRRTA